MPLLLGASPRAPHPTIPHEGSWGPWLATPISGATGEKRQTSFADGGPPFRISRLLHLQSPSAREGFGGRRDPLFRAAFPIEISATHPSLCPCLKPSPPCRWLVQHFSAAIFCKTFPSGLPRICPNNVISTCPERRALLRPERGVPKSTNVGQHWQLPRHCPLSAESN